MKIESVFCVEQIIIMVSYTSSKFYQITYLDRLGIVCKYQGTFYSLEVAKAVARRLIKIITNK